MSKESLMNNNKGQSIFTIAQQKSNDFEYFMNQIKEKIYISSRQEKLQLPTLVSKTWEVRVREYFVVNP